MKDKSFPIKMWLVPAIFFVTTGLLMPVWGHGWKSPPEASLMENPIPVSSTVLARGKELFIDFCSGCHSEDARGGKPENYKSSMVPPDLVTRLASHSQGDFFWKISNGRGYMPGFSEDLSSEEIWKIIHHIDQLNP